MKAASPRRDWLAVWILGSAGAQAAGWTLSLIGHLDRGGYIAAILLFAVILFVVRGQWREPSARPSWLARKATYRHWIPKLWLLLALFALVGGLLLPPDNFDYLTYRFPRLLHWWWDGHWSWLDTPEQRQNTSAVGMEWLMAPLFILFRTDRLYFLINFVSFLFLPGLVFSVFRRMRVAPRMAWFWMWLLPAGFCFILQAASMGNDMFAAVYFLAAIHYAFRVRDGSTFALVLSCLSIALLTGAKASNIPLVLPWLAILALQGRPVLGAIRCLPLLAVAGVVAALASFLPVGLLNIHFTGTYTGDPTNQYHLQASSLPAAFAGNVTEIVLGNLAPPIWPHEFRWPAEDRIVQLFRPSYLRFSLTGVPFQIEETSGMGPGIVLLALLTIIYGFRSWLGASQRRSGWREWLVVGSIVVAWLGYLGKMASEAAPRLVAVYYVAGLLALLLIFPAPGPTVHRRLWLVAAALCFAMAYPLILLNPARPVLPVSWIHAGLNFVHVPKNVLDHLDTGYRLRAQRRDELHDLRQAIPSSETAIGVMEGGDEPNVSLWLPFGSRQVIEIYPATTAADLAARHLHYVAVSSDRLRYEKVQFKDLLAKWSATVVAQQPLLYTLRREPQTWYLLRIGG